MVLEECHVLIDGGIKNQRESYFLGRYIEFICGIISLLILIEGLQVEERRYWDEIHNRGGGG